MRYWLLKTEPSDYSYDDLERDGSTCWDGVGNNLALKNMREVRSGDRAFLYHTGNERSVVGEAEVTSDPYADPELDDPRRVVFDVRPGRRLPRPVPLAELKADSSFEGFDLVRIPRLSVMPVPPELWRRIQELAESS